MVGGAAMAAVTCVLLLASPAWAHVTVHPVTIPAGSSDVELTFRVPNERDNAHTVRLQVFFPSDLPLLTVNVLPIPGWSVLVHMQNLSKPMQTDDGPVSRVVADISWTATTGGIAPGQYQDFDMSVGKVPNRAGAVVFKSLQTYSSGEIVRWIQVANSQDPNPDTPAPALTLTSPGPTPTATASTGSNSSTTEGLAVAAIVLAAIAVIGVTVLLVRGGRRLASPKSSEPVIQRED
jgi:uncharacterized protein YcnI